MATKTVSLTKHGYLRIPVELLPEGVGKKFGFIVTGDSRDKSVELKPCGGETNGTQKRKAMFSNSGARSPSVSIRKALSNLGIELPKDSVSYPVKKKKDGTLVVNF